MSPALAAMLVLFGGQNLDGWIALQGQWAVRDNAMVCVEAPARIRSVYESDACTMTFKYRRAERSDARLLFHATLKGAGEALSLGRTGVRAGERPNVPIGLDDDAWIAVELTVAPGAARVVSTAPDGTALGSAELKTSERARGFVRLEAEKPGLEIRDVRVSEPGFESLFDGRTLKGWEVVNARAGDEANWVAADGVIRCMGQAHSSWLRTLRTYDDFVLRLEYWLPPKGNSGVYLRAPLQGRISQKGLEIQLLDDAGWAGRIKAPQRTGSVYAGIAPEAEVPAPAEQWNAIEILCEGKRVRTTLNGVRLYDVSLDDDSKDQKMLKNPLATRPLEGFIGLQDHTGRPMFRNIRIRELGTPGSRPAGR